MANKKNTKRPLKLRKVKLSYEEIIKNGDRMLQNLKDIEKADKVAQESWFKQFTI